MNYYYYLTTKSTYKTQNECYFLTGVHIHRQGVVSQSESTRVVDVNHVITTLPFLGMSIADYFHFLTWHQKFETLDYLLKPNITLYFMDNQHAVFLEHKPGDNIYDTRKYPFFFMAQRFTTVKVLIVPLNQLPDLAQKLREPLCEVTWLCHMARCGSTTVVQGLNAIPNCVAISESQDIMRHITAVYKSRRIEISDYVKTEVFKEYLRFSVRYALRCFSAEQHVCLKTTASFAYQIFGATAELFPSHRFISMHRDGQGTAKSFWKMGNSHTLLRFGIWTMRKFPTLSQKAYKDAMVVFTNGLQSEVMDMYLCKEITLFLFFYMQWVTNMVTFQRYKSSVKELLMLCYDDFQGDKKGSVMKVRPASKSTVILCLPIKQ